MKETIIIIIMLLANLSTGQVTVKKSVIDSGGGSTTVGNTTLISTVGELAVQENTQGAVHISEGFIGFDVSTVGVEDYTALTGISLYPNPAIDYINISFETDGNYQIQVYDLNGKLVVSNETQESTFQIPVSHLQRATYMVLVKNNETRQFATYKIIKR